jgi:hypothetical protein
MNLKMENKLMETVCLETAWKEIVSMEKMGMLEVEMWNE